MRLIICIFILIIGVFCLNANAQDTSTKEEPFLKEWSAELLEKAEKLTDRVGSKLSTIIFDEISDLEIFETDLWEDADIRLNVERNVYDNHDVMQSWAVVDTLSVPIRANLYNSTILDNLSDTLNFIFSVDLSTRVDFINLRHVLSRDYDSLPSLEELEENYSKLLQKSKLTKETSKNNTYDSNEDYVVISDEEEDLPWYKADPIHYARYGHILNVFSQPFRFPLKAAWKDRLKIGEIMSYRVSGVISLGPSAFWSHDFTGDIDPLNIGASYRVFLNGHFQISVLKESENKFRVKLNVLKGYGQNWSFGVRSKQESYFEGFITEDLGFDVKLTPFKFGLSDQFANIFDVVYQYDLAQELGRKAFEKAVRGNFSFSDEFCCDAEEANNEEDSAIIKLAKRKVNRDLSFSSVKGDYAYLYEHKHESREIVSETKFILPDGTIRVFEGLTMNIAGWKSKLFGSKEEKRYQFKINLDRHMTLANEKNKLALVAEGIIEDSDTYGTELNRYFSEVENAIGKVIFDRVPEYKPKGEITEAQLRIGSQNVRTKTVYGRSSFLYRLQLTEDQLNKFILLPKYKMWIALEYAFSQEEGEWSTWLARHYDRSKSFIPAIINLPLYLVNCHLEQGSAIWHAYKILKRWEKIKNLRSNEKKVRQLVKFFSDKRYGSIYMRLIPFALADEELAYTVRATNKVLGVVWEQGETIADSELLVAEKLNNEIDFEQPGTYNDNDVNAIITGFSIHETGTESLTLAFNIPQRPKFIYIRVNNSDNWSLSNRKEIEIIIPNKGQFNAGNNSIILQAEDCPSYVDAITSVLESGHFYTFYMSASVDGRRWGPLADKRVKYELDLSQDDNN